MSQDSREQFIAAFEAKQGYRPTAAEFGEGFSCPFENGAWWGWQASRAAVVVELPKPFGPDRMVSKAEIYTRNQALDACQAAIEAAGVKVAP